MADTLTTHPLPWGDPAAWAVLRNALTAGFMTEGLRYVLAALLVWLVLHVVLKHRLAHRLIADWPSARDVQREITYSFGTVLVFAAVGAWVFALILQGHVVIYRKPAQFGWLWLVASLPLMILWHDLYFYWTHRLLHTRWLFGRVHGVHHRSRNPSPWAAYSFHPVEALINAGVTPLALLVVPLHWSVLLLFMLHQIVRNALGHAAVETMPRGFVRHWLGRLFTTTTHHHLHHETARGNYGLWFTWWDRWCGTERADYLTRFDKATPLRPCAKAMDSEPRLARAACACNVAGRAVPGVVCAWATSVQAARQRARPCNHGRLQEPDMLKRNEDVDPRKPKRQTTEEGDAQQGAAGPRDQARTWVTVNKLSVVGKKIDARRKLPSGPLGGSGRKTNVSRSS